MERITRALELAYAQRESRQLPAQENKLPAAATQAPSSASGVEFTDTVMFKTPAVSLDPPVRDNERILPPGATGPHGGAYKMLRTQVLKRLDQLGANTLGVLSAGAGEGKTLTAINLAIAIAADPARTVLLVDFDLRNPSIHRRFHHQPAVGVESLLQRRVSVRDAMFKVEGYERLTILPACERIDNSSEVLASARTAEVIAEIRSRYANRVVIFDLPPALQADDALALSRHLQAGLLVVGEGRTKRTEVVRTLQLMHDLTFVGTVLNGSRERDASYYY